MARRLFPHCRIITGKIISSLETDASLLLREKIHKVGWTAQYLNNYSTKYSEYRSENPSYNVMGRRRISEEHTLSLRQKISSEDLRNDESTKLLRDTGDLSGVHIGKNVSKKDRIKFLVDTLMGLENSRDAVYGALDAWVAWERTFPIASLRIALGTLEKEQEWHRIIQVIKWILSKGQGNTMGVYQQLIKALDMDHRAEEAHNFWMKKIGSDLHSVPWKLCTLMISIYYRNDMLKRLVKLFKGLEAYDRKPPEKLVVQKVANAYEMLGLIEEKVRVLEKYNDLFTQKENPKKSKKASRKKVQKSGTSSDQQKKADDAQLISFDRHNSIDDAQVAGDDQQSNTDKAIATQVILDNQQCTNY